jgi:hypothetical protein
MPMVFSNRLAILSALLLIGTLLSYYSVEANARFVTSATNYDSFRVYGSWNSQDLYQSSITSITLSVYQQPQLKITQLKSLDIYPFAKNGTNVRQNTVSVVNEQVINNTWEANYINSRPTFNTPFQTIIFDAMFETLPVTSTFSTSFVITVTYMTSNGYTRQLYESIPFRKLIPAALVNPTPIRMNLISTSSPSGTINTIYPTAFIRSFNNPQNYQIQYIAFTLFGPWKFIQSAGPICIINGRSFTVNKLSPDDVTAGYHQAYLDFFNTPTTSFLGNGMTVTISCPNFLFAPLTNSQDFITSPQRQRAGLTLYFHGGGDLIDQYHGQPVVTSMPTSGITLSTNVTQDCIEAITTSQSVQLSSPQLSLLKNAKISQIWHNVRFTQQDSSVRQVLKFATSSSSQNVPQTVLNKKLTLPEFASNKYLLGTEFSLQIGDFIDPISSPPGNIQVISRSTPAEIINPSLPITVTTIFETTVPAAMSNNIIPQPFFYVHVQQQ